MNSYAKLRPWTESEVCECDEVNELLLVYTLTDNPIHCYQCKGSIDPERLALSDGVVDDVASWRQVFSALYELWLNSGEYEAWAKENLLNRTGQVNVEGLAVSSVLSKQWPTYYWWFYDSDDPIPGTCPSCNTEMEASPIHGNKLCTKCRIVV